MTPERNVIDTATCCHLRACECGCGRHASRRVRLQVVSGPAHRRRQAGRVAYYAAECEQVLAAGRPRDIDLSPEGDRLPGADLVVDFEGEPNVSKVRPSASDRRPAETKGGCC